MEKNRVATPGGLLVVGGSAGSLEVILQFLPDIEDSSSFAIIIVMHRKNISDSTLSDLLSSRTKWQVKEAEEKEPIEPHTIYLAPPDYHLLIEKDHTFSLDASEKVNYSRPSIDITFELAAEVYGRRAVGLLLSGANADGVDGLKMIKRHGGVVAVQNPDEAEISYMPGQAVLHVAVDHVLANNKIAGFVNKLPSFFSDVA